MLQNKRRYQN